MAGKPVLQGSRLTVQFILGLLGHGMSFEEVLDEYRGLERDDVLACLLFAQQSANPSATGQYPSISEGREGQTWRDASST